MSLALTVPTPSSSALPVETNPKLLKEWLIGLSYSHALETGRTLGDALTSLNRTRISDDERIKLLEHYQTSIDMLEGPLEALYATTSLPAKEKSKQAVQIARNLRQELANGYKIVLLERLEKKLAFGNRHIPELVQLILQTHFKLIWTCIRSYANVPEGFWRETHQLFWFSIQNKLIDLPSGPANQSIGGLYKQIQLLALADPYRFAAVDQERVRDLVSNYGSSCQFKALDSAQHPAGFFLIRLEEDLPPMYLGQRPLQLDPSSAILLDTIDLAKHLHKALQSVEKKFATASDKQKVHAWADLLRRSIRQWSISPKRAFQRIRTNTKVKVSPGIRSASQLINSGVPLLPPMPEADEGTPMDMPTLPIMKPLQDTWTVLNESPGGYALRTALPINAQLRVGEVVAIQTSDNPEWLVGCVRWLHQQEAENALDMGLQVLGAKATPSLIRATITHPGASYLPALILPAVPALNLPELLLTSKGSYSALREFHVLTPEKEMVIRAGALNEQTSGYELFEFSRAEESD